MNRTKNIGWSSALGFEIEKRINDLFSVSLMSSYRINECYYRLFRQPANSSRF